VRILHAVQSLLLAEGGVARAVLDAIAVIERRGHRCSLFLDGALDLPVGWQPDEPGRVHRAAPSRVLPGVPVILGAGGLDAALSAADVVHIHQPWCPWLVQAGLACRARGIPYVVSLHGMLDRWSMSQGTAKKRLHLALAGRRMLESAAAVHCTAEEERVQAVRWFRPARAAVIPCIVDLEPYASAPGPELARSTFGLRADVRRLLYLSRIHPKKGLLQAVRALPAIRNAFDAELCVAGDRQDESYARLVEREVESLGIRGHVRWLGHVDGELKRSLVATSDVLVLPTSQENFGLVLFESLLCATPVVTTSGVDAWRELQSSGAAWIAEADPVAVAEAVKTVLGTPSGDMARRTADARRWALGFLDEEAVGGAMEAMYETARRPRMIR
jgi:glycosyltransferase involved in cell wall biosynthesis